jgi:hypothetical protein
MPAYKEKFLVGSEVRIIEARRLDRFQATWRYHHPLKPEQLAYAGQVAAVQKVSFYHGGDVLYELRNVPGIWHEQCLEAPNEPEPK